MENPGAPKRYRTIQINVGGTIFHTTAHTLAKADEDSLLHGLTDTLTTPEHDEPNKNHPKRIFFDRDPSLFEALLYVLRTGQRPVPPTPPTSSTMHETLTRWFRCLRTEANFYGATKALKSAFTPSEFNGIDLTCKHMPLFEGEKSDSTGISAVPDGDFVVSLESRLSWYDWTLKKIRTVVTPFEHGIDVLAHVNNSVVAAARSQWRTVIEEQRGTLLPRLPLYVFDVNHKFPRGWVKYENPSHNSEYGCESVVCGDGGRIILALMQTNDTGSEKKKAVLEVDAETLQVSRVFTKHKGYSSCIKEYGRLQWIESHRLLLATYMADTDTPESSIMLFDMRAPKAKICREAVRFRGRKPNFFNNTVRDYGDVVWSDGHGKIFRLYNIYGRNDDSLMYAGDLRNGLVTWEKCCARDSIANDCTPDRDIFKPGIIAHGKQLFGSGHRSLFVWDDVDDFGLSFRRSKFQWGDNAIAAMAFGGERLYVVRHGADFVEVLESGHGDLI